MKKLIRNRRNPFIYEYGYHAVREEDLADILKYGFKSRRYDPRFGKMIYLDNIYNRILPIYFFTSPHHFKYSPDTMIDYLIDRKFFIKVNVKKFEQFIDFNLLIEKCYLSFDSQYMWRIDFQHDTFWGQEKMPCASLLGKWFKKFDGQIPLGQFKTNKDLILDCIITTQSFTILQDVPAKYIEDVIEIKR